MIIIVHDPEYDGFYTCTAEPLYCCEPTSEILILSSKSTCPYCGTSDKPPKNKHLTTKQLDLIRDWKKATLTFKRRMRTYTFHDIILEMGKSWNITNLDFIKIED